MAGWLESFLEALRKRRMPISLAFCGTEKESQGHCDEPRLCLCNLGAVLPSARKPEGGTKTSPVQILHRMRLHRAWVNQSGPGSLSP